MAKYDVKYTCGHTGIISLVGPNKQREWRLEREAEKLCHECWEAQLRQEREEENRKAAEAAMEQELPTLQGTAKQIAWAETIRQKLLERVNDVLTKIKDERKTDAVIAVERITQQTSASWWIDRRHIESMLDILQLLDEQIKAAKKEQAAREPIVNEAYIEATVRPEKAMTETIAEIRIIGNAIEVHFPERQDAFRTMIKDLKFEWTGDCWKRTLDTAKNNPIDFAAEVGNTLLANGYIIRTFNDEARNKAISGEYEKDHTRWVTRLATGDYTGWFSIKWDRNREDFYNAARRLPRSKWNKPGVVVPPEMFEDVLDFARIHDFKLSEGARRTVEAARQAKELTLIAKVTKPARENVAHVGNKPPVLEIPKEVDIDASLRDTN